MTLKVIFTPFSTWWTRSVRPASTMPGFVTCILLALTENVSAQEGDLSELLVQKEALLADLELQSSQAKQAEKNKRTADGKTAVGYIQAILAAQDGMPTESGSETDFAAAFGASLLALDHLMDAVDAEKTSRREEAKYIHATERALQLGLDIASIDKKIADLYLEQAEARVTLELDGDGQIEIPCPEGAVPFGPIFGEGKCYADRRDSDSEVDQGDLYMTYDQAIRIMEFCDTSPNAAFCR
jgi:hypothetical protein